MPALVWFPRSVESGSNWFLNQVSVAAPQTRYRCSLDDKCLCVEKWSFNLKSALSVATVTGFHSVWVTLKSIFLQTFQTHTQSIQSISHISPNDGSNVTVQWAIIFFFLSQMWWALAIWDHLKINQRHFSERMLTWTAICVKSGLRRFFFFFSLWLDCCNYFPPAQPD